MTFRGILFATAFYGLTLILAILYIPFMLLPDSLFRPLAVFWLRCMLWTARWIGGITWTIDGTEQVVTDVSGYFRIAGPIGVG